MKCYFYIHLNSRLWSPLFHTHQKYFHNNCHPAGQMAQIWLARCNVYIFIVYVFVALCLWLYYAIFWRLLTSCLLLLLLLDLFTIHLILAGYSYLEAECCRVGNVHVAQLRGYVTGETKLGVRSGTFHYIHLRVSRLCVILLVE